MAAAALLTTGMPFWDMWLGMSALQRPGFGRTGDTRSTAPMARNNVDGEQVIPLAEEILTLGTRKVSSGTTRVRRYVVETPVEKQVTLVRERVVVERRRPVPTAGLALLNFECQPTVSVLAAAPALPK